MARRKNGHINWNRNYYEQNRIRVDTVFVIELRYKLHRKAHSL